ncbi:hypothetical protein EHYA_07364 [Embleya hyalina]|uniref:Uncharacterized protein n=1 Tax=Embleya hyalina TaxID=516124 RepID=A0A401YYE2_9ACTN|nr:hypothetical protein EHYA_07364 [Embleya hyalina]
MSATSETTNTPRRNRRAARSATPPFSSPSSGTGRRPRSNVQTRNHCCCSEPSNAGPARRAMSSSAVWDWSSARKGWCSGGRGPQNVRQLRLRSRDARPLRRGRQDRLVLDRRSPEPSTRGDRNVAVGTPSLARLGEGRPFGAPASPPPCRPQPRRQDQGAKTRADDSRNQRSRRHLSPLRRTQTRLRVGRRHHRGTPPRSGRIVWAGLVDSPFGRRWRRLRRPLGHRQGLGGNQSRGSGTSQVCGRLDLRVRQNRLRVAAMSVHWSRRCGPG